MRSMSNIAHAPSSPDARTAPIALWRIAQAFLIALHNLFGAPEDIARAGWLAPVVRKQLSQWLNAGQALFARLMLIEAAALPTPPPARPRVRPPRKPRRIEHRADAPQDWRVALRLFPRSPWRGGAVRASRPKPRYALQSREPKPAPLTCAFPTRPHPRACAQSLPNTTAPRDPASAWPLAERYEAILRAYNDPAPYAQRLARRLHAAPRRASALFICRQHVPDLIDRDAFIILTDAADAALAAAFDSS
jgi:hypothetical protein